ncbi:MAG TPA: hypothetical protein VEK38_01460 [Candidatus Bathyarchaeia archaeon]|nr:hypothetical protein [Candidatus Bathyarchaeia archaeon]
MNRSSFYHAFFITIFFYVPLFSGLHFTAANQTSVLISLDDRTAETFGKFSEHLEKTLKLCEQANPSATIQELQKKLLKPLFSSCAALALCVFSAYFMYDGIKKSAESYDQNKPYNFSYPCQALAGAAGFGVGFYLILNS